MSRVLDVVLHAVLGGEEVDVDGGESVDAPLGVVAFGELEEHELDDKLREGAVDDGGAHVVHESLLVGEVVEGEELRGELFGFGEEVEVGAGVLFADAAGAVGFEGGEVRGVLGVTDVDGAEASEGGAEAGSAGGEDAIEHVNAEGDANDEVEGEADAHEVARFEGREECGAEVNDAPELVLGLAARKASDRITGQISLHQAFNALPSKILVQSTLNNAKEVLLPWSLVSVDASVDPSQGSVHGLLNPRTGCCCRNHIIQCHHNVSANRILQSH